MVISFCPVFLHFAHLVLLTHPPLQRQAPQSHPDGLKEPASCPKDSGQSADSQRATAPEKPGMLFQPTVLSKIITIYSATTCHMNGFLDTPADL